MRLFSRLFLTSQPLLHPLGPSSDGASFPSTGLSKAGRIPFRCFKEAAAYLFKEKPPQPSSGYSPSQTITLLPPLKHHHDPA